MLNKVMIIGNLGKDPEMVSNVCKFSVATSKKWTGNNGNQQEHTEWHRVVCFGKLGELCAKYLQKGRKVYVEGELKTATYEKNGEKRYSTEVVASQVTFLGGAGDGGGGYDKPAAKPASERDSFRDEDIPF